MEQTCLFCTIIRREIPAAIVYENDAVLAFRDIRPQAPVHILIVPKKHIPTAMDVHADDYALLGALWKAVQIIAANERLEKGFRVVVNNGPYAGQEVYHLHIHLLGGRQMTWPPG